MHGADQSEAPGCAYQLSWPKIRTAQDVEKAAEKITQAVQRGKISPFEGTKVMGVMESRSRLMDNANFESRLEKLEENLAASNKFPARDEPVTLSAARGEAPCGAVEGKIWGGERC